MRISRVVLTGAAVGTIAGTGYADLNRTHVFNPAWPPHARLHSAAGWGAVAGAQLLALWLLWRPGPRADDELAVATAAVLPVTCWAPFFRRGRHAGHRGGGRPGAPAPGGRRSA